MFIPKASELNPLLMPMMMPQISDPRIEIQTFNAPNAPFMPDVLPKPIVDIDVKLPDQTYQSRKPILETHSVIDESIDHQKFNNIIVKDLANEFAKTMKKHDPLINRVYHDGVGVTMNGDKPEPSVNLVMNIEERDTRQLTQEKKIDRMLLKLRRMHGQYMSFKRALKSKLETLGFLFERRRIRDLHFALAKNINSIV